MDAAPQKIYIKRKRDQLAPDALYYDPERAFKRPRAVPYVFKRLADPQNSQTEIKPVVLPGPRQFHLTRPTVATSRKRRRAGDDLATFIEIPNDASNTSEQSGIPTITTTQDGVTIPATSTPLKRPNMRIQKTPSIASLSSRSSTTPSDATVAALQAMADQVIATEASTAASKLTTPTPSPRPLKYQPIIPKHRTRKAPSSPQPVPIRIPSLADPEPHKNPTTSEDAMDVDDSSEYVIETYVRHAAPADTPIPSDAGYLIISKSEEELWESYLEADMPSSDEEFASDEEDENAEGWHGADYPDDELSEDDEMGEGAYQYWAKKKKGSDAGSEDDENEEEWGYGSDFEGEEESWREKWI
ncbi:hypothetical protein EJ05DRAFT_38796 [Pseudovirgaria hyperparasitica]|uniref:Transcription factor Iwr1 domain-containing protein n=1 Tax=Pseudovirgaria hyperparasitica TaxID=470096 RepID=A0A6A6WMS4_9PEZI|nr:uncharacterized protein EJ05DRAFT_38796 [Pseudovirgaria hyperparasitica]KAF2763448.1 hypothetical protein EJ05DRAFT_38796 [Pseudovirgaria hyperparasitica]